MPGRTLQPWPLGTNASVKGVPQTTVVNHIRRLSGPPCAKAVDRGAEFSNRRYSSVRLGVTLIYRQELRIIEGILLLARAACLLLPLEHFPADVCAELLEPTS